MRESSNRRQRRVKSAMARAVMEAFEPRVLMSVSPVLNAIPVTPSQTLGSIATAVRSTGYTGTYLAVQASPIMSSSVSTGYLEIPTTSAATGISDLSDIQLQLNNTATSGSFAPHAGGFSIYFIPNDSFPISSMKDAGSSTNIVTGIAQIGSTGGTGLNGTYNDLGIATGSEAAYKIGTWQFTANGTNSTSALPSGYETFVASATGGGSTVVLGIGDAGSGDAIGAQAKAGIIADINLGKPIRLAIVANDATFSADWEGSYTSAYPILTVDGTAAPKVQFGAATFTATQAKVSDLPVATTPVSFTVTRSTDPTDTTTMNWSATNDTANSMIGGFSADATSGSVTFLPGETSKTVTINVNTPTTFSSQLTGTFDIALSDPGTNSPASILGTLSTATVVVAYAQPQSLGLSVGSTTVNEAAGTLSVTINRSGAGTDACSVTLSTADGIPYTYGSTQTPQDAQAARDYTTVNQVVNFSAGQNSAIVTIPLINVKTFQGTRNFTINLSNRVNCALDTVQETVAITDNAVTATAPNVAVYTPASSTSYSAPVGTGGLGAANSYIAMTATAHNSFSPDAPEVEFSFGNAGTVAPLGYEIGTVDSLTLSLYNTATAPGGYGGTPGSFSVYAITNDSVTTSSLRYHSTNSGFARVSTVAGAGVFLGNAQFTNNVVGYNDFTFDNIPASVTSAIVAEQAAGKPIRFVIIPNDPNVAADWEGNYSSAPLLQPKLTMLVEQSAKPTETISLDSENPTTTKTAGTYNIQIDRSGDTTLDATVQVTLHDGNAVFGTDYTTAASTGSGATFLVTIPAGQSSVGVPITLLNPAGYGDRAFSVTIANPVQNGSVVASLGATTLSTATIVDPNDKLTTTTIFTYPAAPTPGGTGLSEGDFETTGSFDSTEFKATTKSAAYPSFSVVDLQPLFQLAPPITSISSATLTASVSNKFAAAAGVVDFYLVSDSDPAAHPIVPQTPATKTLGFYDSKQGVEGLGSQFGSKILLGSFYYTGASSVSVPLVQSAAGQQALITAINNYAINPNASFRIVMTPEDTNVVADFNPGTIALTINANNEAQIGVAPTVVSSQVGDGSAQRSSVQSFSVTFSEPVNFDTSSFTLFSENLNPDGSLSGTQTAVSSSALTASSSDGITWKISVVAGGSLDRGGGFLADGVYQLVLHGSHITDKATTSAQLGSGDQILQFNSVEAGGASNYFHALYGDVDGSGSVGRSSFNAFKAAYGSSTGDSNFNSLFDFDGSGSIGRSVFNQFKANYGKSYSY